MNTTRDYVLIEIKKIIEDEHKIGDMVIHLYDGEESLTDGSYNPEERKRIFGTVVALPNGFSANVCDFSNIKLNQLPTDIKVGDTAYFHYLSLNKMNIVEFNKKKYLRVRYDKVIAVVRDGNIIPVSGWLLIQPKKKELKVLEYSKQEEVTNTGVVKFVSTPYIGTDLEVKQGDTVCYETNLEFENKIENENYYCIKQEYIICKLEEK